MVLVGVETFPGNMGLYEEEQPRLRPETPFDFDRLPLANISLQLKALQDFMTQGNVY